MNSMMSTAIAIKHPKIQQLCHDLNGIYVRLWVSYKRNFPSLYVEQTRLTTLLRLLANDVICRGGCDPRNIFIERVFETSDNSKRVFCVVQNISDALIYHASESFTIIEAAIVKYYTWCGLELEIHERGFNPTYKFDMTKYIGGGNAEAFMKSLLKCLLGDMFMYSDYPCEIWRFDNVDLFLDMFPDTKITALYDFQMSTSKLVERWLISVICNICMEYMYA